MLKYFILGFISCVFLVVAFVVFILKVIYPMLEKMRHRSSSERLYKICQELINR